MVNQKQINHMLPLNLPDNSNIVIIGNTLKSANELFEKINIIQLKYFSEYNLHRKRTLNGLRFFCTGITSCIPTTRGLSLNIIIINEDVEEACILDVMTYLYPVLVSSKIPGIIMQYSNNEGLVAYKPTYKEETTNGYIS